MVCKDKMNTIRSVHEDIRNTSINLYTLKYTKQQLIRKDTPTTVFGDFNTSLLSR